MPAHPHTGPGAEGGGGWPMQATAQPWHAEGRPPPTGALRRQTEPWNLAVLKVQSVGAERIGAPRERGGFCTSFDFASSSFKKALHP